MAIAGAISGGLLLIGLVYAIRQRWKMRDYPQPQSDDPTTVADWMQIK